MTAQLFQSPHQNDSEDVLLNSLRTALLVLDSNNKVVRANAASEKLLELSAKNLSKTSLLKSIPAMEPLIALAQKARDQQKSFTLRTLELALRPGTVVILDCHALPIFYASGSDVLLELHDVTQHEKIQREADLVNQHGVSRTIVRQLAHEIKNPLGGIRGSAQLLSRKLEREENKRFIEVIISEVDRLAQLVDSMLGPGQPSALQSTNIHRVLDKAIDLVQTEGEINLLRDYDPSLPELWLDPDQMLQVFLNLLRNAHQALGNQGEIVVRSRIYLDANRTGLAKRPQAAIEIQDNGPGVPQELRNKIFFPLVSGQPGGTGIGLALVQELLERHAGSIEYRSHPGETIFTVYLPIEDRSA